MCSPSDDVFELEQHAPDPSSPSSQVSFPVRNQAEHRSGQVPQGYTKWNLTSLWVHLLSHAHMVAGKMSTEHNLNWIINI